MNEDELAQARDHLLDELERFPLDHYPVQHATTQFHLGTVLLQAGRPAQAAQTFELTARVFDPDRLPLEHAKAANMLGVALRTCGRHEQAAPAFARAAAIFQELDHGLEQAAATYNLGLVLRETGRDDDARRAFEDALDVFVAAHAWPQAASASRDLAATLLERGEAKRSVDVAEEAVGHADRAGDLAGLGAACNVHGLALLADGRPEEALARLQEAAATDRRDVRPEGYAVAMANLALAAEACGAVPRARLAAHQALASPHVSAAAEGQARAVLERLGDEPGQLHAVLDPEPHDRWMRLVRDEVTRWADAPAETLDAEVAAWVAGHDGRADAETRAYVWVAVLLEIPPDATERVVAAALSAVTGQPDATFVETTSRVMVRFGVPQYLRLKDTFARISDDVGLGVAWG